MAGRIKTRGRRGPATTAPVADEMTPGSYSGLLILAPLAIEARALRSGIRRPSTTVIRTGMGPRAAARAGERLASGADGGVVAIAGFCGGLRPDIRPGDVIVASDIRGPDGVHAPAPAAVLVASLVDALRSVGLNVHVGTLSCSEHLGFGRRRAQLAAKGALGVEMESYWLLAPRGAVATATAPTIADRAVVVVRAVSDTVGAGLLGGMLPRGWLRAYRSLTCVAPVLEEWAANW